MRAERAGNEIADWVGIMSAVMKMPPDGTFPFNGLIARGVARACGAGAATLGPAVLFSSSGWKELDRKSEVGLILLAHELVHIRQYRKLGWLRFLWAYGVEYFAGRLQGLSHRQAYRAISFEREARRGEAVARSLLDHDALLRGTRL
jgi:hypothetical protein